jgi:transposase-like protein
MAAWVALVAGAGGHPGTRELTKMVLAGALAGAMDDHLGYAKHDPEGRNSGKSRNGSRVSWLAARVLSARGTGGLLGCSSRRPSWRCGA